MKRAVSSGKMVNRITLQLVTRFRSNTCLSPFSQFKDEMWSGTVDPDEAEMDILMKEGAPGKKNFTAWFREKVNSNLSPYLACLVNSNT